MRMLLQTAQLGFKIFMLLSDLSADSFSYMSKFAKSPLHLTSRPLDAKGAKLV